MQQANNIPKFSSPAPQLCSKPKTVKNLHKKSFSKFKHVFLDLFFKLDLKQMDIFNSNRGNNKLLLLPGGQVV